MKYTMTTLLNHMAKDDDDVLKRIIESHYLKFNILYYMIKNELKKVKDVEYNYSTKKSLDVTLLFASNKSASSAYNSALEYIENTEIDGLQSNIELINKNIDIHINYDESKWDTSSRKEHKRRVS